MDTPTLKTYKVPEENLDVLQTRIARLVRRCKRIKVEAPVLTVGTFEEIRYKNEAGFDRIRRVYSVTLQSAGRPKIHGFEFAAVISPVTDEDGKLLGNVLRRVPGFDAELPKRFREATNYCDHCKTDRRRNETFIIYGPTAHGTGYRQIGRNCLANYLGLTDPEQYAELAQILISADELCEMSEDRDGRFGGSGTPERVPLDEVLAVAAAAIRLYGWLSRKSAREFEKQATADRVGAWIFGSSKTRDEFEHKLTPTEEDKKLAEDTFEWLGTITDTENDYRYNLSLLAKAVSITGKNFGIAVSAINAYSKEKEIAIRRNARIQSDAKSEFIGTVGERIKIENAVVLYTTTFETDYGVTHFFKLKAGDNIIVYFASNQLWQQGETIPSVTARVKKHEVREDKRDPLAPGVKQTVITRATLPKPEPTPEQKKAKKGIAKLRRLMKQFPHTAADQREGNGTIDDYNVWVLLNDLEWKIRQEFHV